MNKQFFSLFWCVSKEPVHVHVHTIPKKLEDAAIFIRLEPTVHTNQSRKRSFSKTLVELDESEKPRLFVLVWREIILKTELFQKRGNFVISLPEFSLRPACSNGHNS